MLVVDYIQLIDSKWKLTNTYVVLDLANQMN